MKKINEFVISNDFSEKIEELIYFDEFWKFPEYNLNNHLNLLENEYNELIIISKKVIDKLNNQNIDPNSYTKDIFFKILKSI
jgi:hypothetical protein